ncbi:hypothetical protein HYU94_01985 [Candidatus Daviesbacteria bacterium]|nr:hypothetical protein [Candidatus Daviesbacteria bacterium]
MAIESLIVEIEQINQQLSPQAKANLLTTLRMCPTDIDDQRVIEWKPGNIYFHSLQDLRFAILPSVLPEEIRMSQACFVKDLDLYLKGFPKTEAEEIYRIFQTIFNAGTSFYWDEDRDHVKNLYEVYCKLDKEIIRPWVNVMKL